jgi:hypothetical protein
VLKIAREPISLETPIGEEEDSHLGDFIEDKKFMLPSEAAVSLNLAEQTRKVLATLTPREEKVLRMRFGIGEKADHTLEEVGKDFAVTRERIRQIEAKALRKLRHPTRSRKLKSFLPPKSDRPIPAPIAHRRLITGRSLVPQVGPCGQALTLPLAPGLTKAAARDSNQGVFSRTGPIAQLAEPPAHNRSVPGSIPGGPTHTNLDSAPGGLNDLFGRRLGLRRMRALSVKANPPPAIGPGIGRVGELARPKRLAALARDVKMRLGAPMARLVGDPRALVRCVAVSTGSGGSLVPDFLRSDAEVFISGDLGYHDARDVEYAGRSLIDVGHFHSEHFMKGTLVKRLQEEFSRRRMGVRVQACPLETDPFTLV